MSVREAWKSLRVGARACGCGVQTKGRPGRSRDALVAYRVDQVLLLVKPSYAPVAKPMMFSTMKSAVRPKAT
jgi:hypothetical protein